MPLTCSCDYGYEFEPGGWYYTLVNNDFEKFLALRRKRCCSCGELINIGKFCLRHERVRYPYTDAEARINGVFDLETSMEDEAKIKASDHIQCEKCGEIWLNLQSVGFECLSPAENMPEMLKQYQHDYAPAVLLSEEKRAEKLIKMKSVVETYKQRKTKRFIKR